jgi:hypothetical protein
VPRSKNEWRYTSTPKCAFMAWCSVKEQGQLYLYLYFVTRNLSRGGVITTPNPQPGGPVDYTYSGSYPLTCLAWVTLPGAYAPASIALGVIRANKPPHPQHVIRQGGSSRGGSSSVKYYSSTFKMFWVVQRWCTVHYGCGSICYKSVYILWISFLVCWLSSHFHL